MCLLWRYLIYRNQDSFFQINRKLDEIDDKITKIKKGKLPKERSKFFINLGEIINRHIGACVFLLISFIISIAMSFLISISHEYSLVDGLLPLAIFYSIFSITYIGIAFDEED